MTSALIIKKSEFVEPKTPALVNQENEKLEDRVAQVVTPLYLQYRPAPLRTDFTEPSPFELGSISGSSVSPPSTPNETSGSECSILSPRSFLSPETQGSGSDADVSSSDSDTDA